MTSFNLFLIMQACWDLIPKNVSSNVSQLNVLLGKQTVSNVGRQVCRNRPKAVKFWEAIQKFQEPHTFKSNISPWHQILVIKIGQRNLCSHNTLNDGIGMNCFPFLNQQPVIGPWNRELPWKNRRFFPWEIIYFSVRFCEMCFWKNVSEI